MAYDQGEGRVLRPGWYEHYNKYGHSRSVPSSHALDIMRGARTGALSQRARPLERCAFQNAQAHNPSISAVHSAQFPVACIPRGRKFAVAANEAPKGPGKPKAHLTRTTKARGN